MSTSPLPASTQSGLDRYTVKGIIDLESAAADVGPANLAYQSHLRTLMEQLHNAQQRTEQLQVGHLALLVF